MELDIERRKLHESKQTSFGFSLCDNSGFGAGSSNNGNL